MTLPIVSGLGCEKSPVRLPDNPRFVVIGSASEEQSAASEREACEACSLMLTRALHRTEARPPVAVVRFVHADRSHGVIAYADERVDYFEMESAS